MKHTLSNETLQSSSNQDYKYFPQESDQGALEKIDIKMRYNYWTTYLTVIPWARVVYELIANETRSAELVMSSYTTRANGIIVLLYKQTRYFCCCVVKQLPDFLLIHFSKTFSHFVFFHYTNRIWSDSLLIEAKLQIFRNRLIIAWEDYMSRRLKL